MPQTENPAYEAAVAELDDEVFARAADLAASAIVSGEGLRMWFQPGDATRYLVEVGRRATVVVSNGETDHEWLGPQASVHITFGVEGDFQTFAIGHISRLRPDHGWTATVWRRLWTEVESRLA